MMKRDHHRNEGGINYEYTTRRKSVFCARTYTTKKSKSKNKLKSEKIVPVILLLTAIVSVLTTIGIVVTLFVETTTFSVT